LIVVCEAEILPSFARKEQIW